MVYMRVYKQLKISQDLQNVPSESVQNIDLNQKILYLYESMLSTISGPVPVLKSRGVQMWHIVFLIILVTVPLDYRKKIFRNCHMCR